jgi:hypothetical protein
MPRSAMDIGELRQNATPVGAGARRYQLTGSSTPV